MSERSYPASIGSLREIRPTEDLSLLKAHEIRRYFEIETIKAPDRIESTAPADAHHPIAAPMLIDPASEAAPDFDLMPLSPSKSDDVRSKPAARGDRPTSSPRNAETEPAPGRDWLLQPEPQAVAEPQPYGDDPERLRALLQWFADGRAASSIIQAPRAAGDLVDIARETAERPDNVRALLKSQRLA
jgi:hypothetical protein